LKKIKIDPRDERITSAREEFKAKVEETDPEMAKAFEDMSPEQKLAGKLIGKLLEAKGNATIEDAFMWYEQSPDGGPMDWFKRMMAMYVAIEHSGANDQKTYNACRKILIMVNNR
jgi:hypothetical protein